MNTDNQNKLVIVPSIHLIANIIGRLNGSITGLKGESELNVNDICSLATSRLKNYINK